MLVLFPLNTVGMLANTVTLTIKMRDGSVVTQKLRSMEGLEDEIDSLGGADTFWGTFRDIEKLKPTDEVRTSTMEYDSDFDFGSISYDDHDSDSDYQ